MADFDYPLPDEAIAQQPATPRDAARLLVATGGGVGALSHRTVADLPGLVGPGDVVVVNDTRVLPARLVLAKPTGGRVEVLLLEPDGPVDGPDGSGTAGAWVALVRPSRKVAPGTVLSPGDDLVVTVGDDLGEGRRRVRVDAPDGLQAALDRHGAMPLPPYLTEGLDDPDRYQTVFARRPGSVAAPTAGLHLTDAVLDGCRAAGATIARVDLQVGLDTFRPVTVDDPADHHIHTERYSVPDDTLAACDAAERVIAVGTTTVRALESAARGEPAGRTTLFIRPPFEFRVVDVLLTNFHLPRSSLLLLVEAFAGPRWRDLYATALAEGYRFLSFGDAMLVDRA